MRFAIAVVCGRFLVGAVCGLLLWILSWRFGAPIDTDRTFLVLVVGGGALCLFWPVLRTVTHGILRRLPFFSRYKWS